GDGTYQHAHLVGHPAFLIPSTFVGHHLAVIRHCGYTLVLQRVDSLLHAVDGGCVHDEVAFAVVLQSPDQQLRLRIAVAFLHYVTEVTAAKGGNVLGGVGHTQ